MSRRCALLPGQCPLLEQGGLRKRRSGFALVVRGMIRMKAILSNARLAIYMQRLDAEICARDDGATLSEQDAIGDSYATCRNDSCRLPRARA